MADNTSSTTSVVADNSEKPSRASTVTGKTSKKSPPPKPDNSTNGKMREILDIVRALNGNVNAQNARLEKQEKRLDEMFEYMNHNDEDYMSYEQNTDNFEQNNESETNEDNCSNEGPTSIFRLLSDKFNRAEQVDPKCHVDLAGLVNNSFRNGLSDENLEDMLKNIKRPENCDSLVKTRVNQGIWRLLKSHTQAEDSRLSSIQGVLLKASANIVKLVEKLSEEESFSEHLELGTNAIALLGHVNKMLNSKRKDLHKSDLDYKYHYLASASLPYTDLLYGDDTDVNNNIKEINNMNRIGKTVARGSFSRGQSRGRRPYNPYNMKGRGSFRGYRGRGFFPSTSKPASDVASKNFAKTQKK